MDWYVFYQISKTQGVYKDGWGELQLPHAHCTPETHYYKYFLRLFVW